METYFVRRGREQWSTSLPASSTVRAVLENLNANGKPPLGLSPDFKGVIVTGYASGGPYDLDAVAPTHEVMVLDVR